MALTDQIPAPKEPQKAACSSSFDYTELEEGDSDCIALEESVQDLLDSECNADSNMQHLKYVLVGYRDYIRNRAEVSEFSPDGARDTSWKMGRDLAIFDMTNAKGHAPGEKGTANE